MTPDRYTIQASHPYPNSTLPVLVYPEACEADTAHGRIEEVTQRFTAAGWSEPWLDGVYPFHHFHADAHEVLACVEGWVKVQLGGPEGEIFELAAGDIVLLPAGVAHKRVEASEDYRIAGSYPDGQSPDLQKGDPAVWDDVCRRVRETPLWTHDPVTGEVKDRGVYE